MVTASTAVGARRRPSSASPCTAASGTTAPFGSQAAIRSVEPAAETAPASRHTLQSTARARRPLGHTPMPGILPLPKP
ncbi:hypothetical protein GCM10009738_43100 [Kitasatospora viridis]